MATVNNKHADLGPGVWQPVLVQMVEYRWHDGWVTPEGELKVSPKITETEVEEPRFAYHLSPDGETLVKKEWEGWDWGLGLVSWTAQEGA